MTRTLFSKMMLAFTIVIVITTVLSVLFVSTLIENRKIEDAEVEMIKTTQEVNNLAELKYRNVISSRELSEQLVSTAAIENDIIWLVENNSIWVTHDIENFPELSEDVILQYYGDMMDTINKGEIAVSVSRSDPPFNFPVITVGAPITTSDSNEVVGAVFVHKQLSSVTSAMIDVRIQIIIAGLISILIAVVLCYFISRSILKPLKHVTNAAKQLSKGNFDVRIDHSTEDEIGQLAKTFNQVSEDLGKYESTRQTFVANVSHDLRSPLTSMQGFVQGILDGTIPEEKRDYYLDIVLNEIKRLNVLINDLLDLTRIESGTIPMNMSDFDINELVRRGIITFESKIRAGKIDVDVSIPDGKLMVSGDNARLTQVLMNLIDNAVKFTPENGTISLSVRDDKYFISVSVANTGSYISKDDRQFIFERFYKADKSRNREKQGTGLGLSIAKKIIDQHGQKIWVESSKKKGTKFTFTLRKSAR